jgi:hypothetical protein
MSLNVNINPLNFREMRLREPQGARQFGEAIDAWKRGAARRRAERIEDEDRATEKAERDFKREQDNKLADMLSEDGNIDAQIVDIENQIADLENENSELMKGR